MPLITERPRAHLLAIAALVATAAIVHRTLLVDPALHFDEGVFVGAARAVAAGGSAYDHPVYNYPPLVAELGGWSIRLGGEGAFVAAARTANVTACAALAWLAASFAGLRVAGRFGVAVLLLVASPLVREALWLGNLAPVAVLLALVAWSIGARRPLASGALQAVSLAVKPVALLGVVYLAARRAVSARGASGRAAETCAVVAGTLLLLVPWLEQIPELARRMAEPPLFSSRNLSLRRALLAAGIEPPAALIAFTVLAAALWLARRRPLDAVDRLHVSGVVALLALPVAWPHGFLIVLPLQVEAARLWWNRRAERRGGGRASRLAERWGVPLALIAIQASAASGVEFAGPELAQLPVVLVPALAPVALLAYRLRFAPDAGAAEA